MVNELIGLLLTGEIGTSGEDFKKKFQNLLDRVPKIHSPLQPEFFTHFFLGSVLTLPYTKLMGEVGIKDVYVKVDHRSKVVKLVFKIENSQGKQLVFKTITTAGTAGDKQRLSRDELKEILGTLGLTKNEVANYEIKGEIIHIKDVKNRQQKVIDRKLFIKELKVDGENLDVAVRRIVNSGNSLPRVNAEQAQFKKAQDNIIQSNFGNSLEKVNNINTAKEGTEEFFKNLAQVYRSEKVLPSLNEREIKKRIKLGNSEAADHGFTYGALAMNFKYEYALDINVERIAGKGYADLMFISRRDGGQNKKMGCTSNYCRIKKKR